MTLFKNYEQLVRKLREEGKTYKYISEITGLSKGCLLYNCCDTIKKGCKKRNTGRKKTRLPQRLTEAKCLNCDNLTLNPKFCSMKCSGIYNNANSSKIIESRRTKTKSCKTCTTLIYSSVTYCDDCFECHRWDGQKLSDLIYQDHHKSSTFAKIRTRARSISKRLKFCKCMKCGYDQHFEVCHIKAIADFPLDTLYEIINAESNLIALCPNCHWEFDNGKITLDEINTIRSNYK